MIYIISGWSNPGGSTTSWINLTNALNEKNIDCVFYGPHQYHLSKCRSGLFNNQTLPKLTNNDRLIVHFLNLQKRIFDVKKLVFSSHEQDIFEFKKLINLSIFDFIHYVSDHQKKYHNCNHPSVIIPNIVNDLKISENKPKNIAGIIGSIDKNKQTHVSIQRAITDGFKKILIYGIVTDRTYFEQRVNPLINQYKEIIDYKGFEENKQKMYDSISHLYHSSIRETWSYTYQECKLTNTVFIGNESIGKDIEYWTKDQIINKWINVLEL